MRKKLAVVIAVLLLATMMMPLTVSAADAKIVDKLTVQFPDVEGVTFTFTDVLDQYFNDPSFMYGAIAYLFFGENATISWDKDIAIQFQGAAASQFKAGETYTIAELSGYYFYNNDNSLFYFFTPYLDATYDLDGATSSKVNASLADLAVVAAAATPAAAEEATETAAATPAAAEEATETAAAEPAATEEATEAAAAEPAATDTAVAATGSAVSVSTDSIFLSVSVDGVLQLAAQPMLLPADATVNGVLAAAHEQFFSDGLNGYIADTNNQYNMFLITKCWGVTTTPYCLVNNLAMGSAEFNAMADTAAVKAGDNVVISLSSDMNTPAQAISLTADVADGSATVTATAWVLDFSTFTYKSSPVANASVVDPVSGTALGTTDANGQVVVPATGIVAIAGSAAIPVDGSCGSTSTAAAPAAAAPAAPAAPAAAAPTGDDTTVYVTISIDGVLQIACQPVVTNVLTVDGALKAAHEQYYSGGAAGYHGGNASFGYMIDTIWGVQTTPYVIIGGAPLGSAKGEYSDYMSVDQCPVKEGDNIVVVFSAEGATLPVVALTEGEDGYIIATSWSLDFTTFSYTEATYVEADVIDAETGDVLATTDAFGKFKIKKAPACGVVAITGLTAIPVGEVKSFAAYDGVYVPPAHDYRVFGGKDGRLLLKIVVVALAFAIPLGIVVSYAQNKELKSKGVKYAEAPTKLKKR